MAERLVLDGQEVVEIFDIPSQKSPSGYVRDFSHFEGLRLADGTERYRCTEEGCDWISDTTNNLAGHRKKHSLHLPPRVRELTVGQLVEAYADMKRLAGERSDSRPGEALEKRVRDLQRQLERQKERHEKREKDLKEENKKLKKDLKSAERKWRSIQELLRSDPKD